ncbi:outer membrane protein assembly factor BamB family protein [Halorubrum vacuolatum]|uniref:Outer membrane protein assembly factor BamB, contains PQQ-like beta-propeller repeat n=1 Tax=Halorubrum vacuolatum TaxID=63740 RepID=A0A238W9Q8_HALVU|nr:PQQ-binding-like beta-propeller repeat protein [Halorubrum vacuolatum]SNR43270.1 Outer membrane protein assembly factor BamB, contains PQQ-like beta-propeller repeat [Halorubrum vacuolatum]
MREFDLSRRHFLTASSLVPLSGVVRTDETDLSPQTTPQLVGPSQEVIVTPEDTSIPLPPETETTIPVTIIIEISGGFSVFGDEIEEADVDIELSDLEVEGDDTDGEFTVNGGGPEITLHNEEPVTAPSTHAVTLFLQPTGDEPTIEVIDSDQDVTDNTRLQYNVIDELDWSLFAEMAGRREVLFENYAEAYAGVTEAKAWEEQFAKETVSILSDLAVASVTSKVAGVTAEVIDSDWPKVAGAAYGLRNGLSGTSMSQAVKSTFDLKNDFFDYADKAAIECAGNSDEALVDLQELASDEKDAWEQKNRTGVIEALEKQRERLFDTSTGSGSLWSESGAQRYYSSNLGRVCDGTPPSVGKTKDDVRDFFEMLQQYSRDEDQNLRDILRFVDPPSASVSTVRHHGVIDAELRQVATGEKTKSRVEFEVSNGSSAGLTSNEGYLSISHSDKLAVDFIEAESDDVISVTRHKAGEDEIIQDDGTTDTAEHTLLDINGQYEPGETKRLVVEFSYAGDEPIDDDDDDADDAFEDVWFRYRSALEPILTAEDPESEAGQNEFARAPEDNGAQGVKTDQQGFTAYEVSAGNIEYPPIAKIDAPAEVMDDSVTFDASESTAGSDIESFSWVFERDDDGSFEETRSGESVDDVTFEPGVVTARLTVEDDRGLVDETETEVIIEEVPPVIASFDRRPSAPEPGDVVEFTSTGDADSYEWEIDGQNYSGESVSVTFDDPGEYEVSLEVSRSGENDEITSTFTVEDIEERLGTPRARIDVIGDLKTGEEIEFDGSDSYHPRDDRSIDTYKWEIKEEEFERESINYTFDTAGSYQIDLTVVTKSDNDETTDEAVTTINIGDASLPPDIGTITGIVTDDSDDPVTDVELKFGDTRTDELVSTTKTSEEGKYETDLPAEATYEVIIDQVEFESFSTEVTIQPDETRSEDVQLTRTNLPGEELWTFQTNSRIFSSPTVVDGTVYIGSNDNNIYALDTETGEEQWRFNAGSSVRSSPAVVDGIVYVGSDDSTFGAAGNVYALDASNGSEIWSFEEGATVQSSPTVANGTVYFGRSDDNVYALDAATGQKEWFFETDGAVISSPTVLDGTVYIGSEDNSIYALDADDGNKKWELATGDSVRSSPTVEDGIVYVGSDDNNVYALDAETGEEEWTFEAETLGRSSPTVIDGTVYIGTNDLPAADHPHVYALDAKTGEREWGYETSGRVRSSPTVAGSTVFVGGGEGSVYALDADASFFGDRQWRFEPVSPWGFFSSPTVADGTVYIADWDDPGTVYALSAGVDGSSEDSRTSLGTLGHNNDWAEAQSGTINPDTGTLTGRVTGPDDDSLEAAEINVVDSETGDLEATATTDTDGEYSIERIDEGTYEVVIKKSGFDRVRKKLSIEPEKNELHVSLDGASLSPIVGDDPPQDLNGDGLYEDINGDGTADVVDVQALQQNLDSEEVQQNSEAFNFADDDPDEVTEADVEALYDRVTGGDSDE